MGSRRELAEYFLELCSEVEDRHLRTMFGGHGLYSGTHMFALEAYGELYLKTDEKNREEFERIGALPFVYEGKNGKKTVMSYYKPPAEYLESDELLAPLVRSAVEAARRSRANTKKSQKKRSGKAAAPEERRPAKKSAGKPAKKTKRSVKKSSKK